MPFRPRPIHGQRERSTASRPFLLAAPIVAALVLAVLALLAPAGAFAEYDDIVYPASRYGPEVPLTQVVQDSAVVLDPDGYLPDARVEIEKSTRQLRLFSGGRLLKTYRMQLGKNPKGTKLRRYDGRTPVGSYKVCGRNRWSRYYLSLQIDYPNEQDIARGVREKRITEAQARTLREELAQGACPRGNTRLGGEIFIHGQHPKITRQVRAEKRKKSTRKDLEPGDLDPGAMKEWYDWTLGCIALANPDIRELFRLVPDGTPVEIRE